MQRPAARPLSTGPETVSLLGADPDLGALLSSERRREAEADLVVRASRLAPGTWDVASLAGTGTGQVGLLVLDGVIWREVAIAGQLSAELLGPGDLLRPWQFESRDSLLPVTHAYTVLATTTLALLDGRFARHQMTRWPEITMLLLERLTERSLRLATAQAISQLTRSTPRRRPAVAPRRALGPCERRRRRGPAGADAPHARRAGRGPAAHGLDRPGGAHRSRGGRAPPRRDVAAAGTAGGSRRAATPPSAGRRDARPHPVCRGVWR